ncbi:MAG: sensor histidine kinase [Saprospiraceae bacterium]|nr:sensor histidine kinase [Saprospiraceae bacterium]
MAKKNHDPCLESDNYSNLYRTYLLINNTIAAEEMISNVKISILNCSNPASLARYHDEFGKYFYKRNEYDSAFYYFQKSSEFYFRAKDSIRGMNALSQLGLVYLKKDLPSLAIKHFKAYYDYVQLYGSNQNKIHGALQMASTYNKLSDGIQALSYVIEAEKIANKVGDKYSRKNILDYKAWAYENVKEYETALKAYHSYMDYYKDTLIPEQRLKEIENLRTKYEIEKKESTIEVQKQQLRNGNIILLSIIGILTLLSIGAIVLYLFNKKLKKSNKEKEFLIKEIHHRVKNNLQVLSSLLHLQSRYIKDEVALDAMREGQNRVDAMGLIHQKLYTGNNLANVEMREYVSKLGNSLLDSFGIHDNRIEIVYNLSKLYLDVEKAIPLGLIINELITNSLKHAFDPLEKGIITIELHKNYLDNDYLVVSDTGRGNRQQRDEKQNASFGTGLISILTEKLNGKIEINQENGYQTKISFENLNL